MPPYNPRLRNHTTLLFKVVTQVSLLMIFFKLFTLNISLCFSEMMSIANLFFKQSDKYINVTQKRG